MKEKIKMYKLKNNLLKLNRHNTKTKNKLIKKK